MKSILFAAMALGWLMHIAAANEVRVLSAEESEQLIGALLGHAGEPLSEEPSCRADLSVPGQMTVAEGLAVQLQQAVTGDEPVHVSTFCIERPGYPKEADQEYCVVNFSVEERLELGYGLVFLMDWQSKAPAPGSIECY